MVGDAALVDLVHRLTRHRVAPRPAADGELDARGASRAPAAKGQGDQFLDQRAGVLGVPDVETLDDLFGGRVAPGVEHAAQQVVAVLEVPVEAAPRNAELARQRIDAHGIHAMVDKQRGGGGDPVCRRERAARLVAVGRRHGPQGA